MKPYWAMCTYLVIPDRLEEFRALMRVHWPTLLREGLVTSDPPVIYYGEDSGGPFFVEIIRWASSDAPSRAYWNEEVNAIWTLLYEFTETRNGRPGIEYPAVEPQYTDLGHASVEDSH